MSIQEIESAVTQLPPEEFAELMERLEKLQEEQWDKQSAADVRSGRFDALIEQAKQDFAEGRYKPL